MLKSTFIFLQRKSLINVQSKRGSDCFGLRKNIFITMIVYKTQTSLMFNTYLWHITTTNIFPKYW